MNETILILEHGFPDLRVERELTDEAGIELVAVEASTPDEVVTAIQELDGTVDAILTQYTSIPNTVFEHASDLDVVGRYGIGVDNVDLESATEHDVRVINVPDYCVEEVTSHTLALILALTRKIPSFHSSVSAGTWDWQVGKPMNRLAGSTLGFAGFGNIPRRLREKVAGFDFELIAYDPYQSSEELRDHGVEKVAFAGLLDRSDIITIHTPLNDDTRGMFDGTAFERMKDTAYIVNTSRGPVIDIDDLHRALVEGQVAGAGLDVLPEEPPDEPPFTELENVVVTPHVAWYSEESILDLRRTLVADVIRGLRERPVNNPVNDI